MSYMLIDGFNMAYRSQYAFSSISNSKGMPSGCVYGFLTSLRALKKRYPEDHFIIAWDNEASRRKKIYGEYKANRTSKINIRDQIADLKSIFHYVNVSQAEVIGEEADDVIATLAKQYRDTNHVNIFSSDKDLLQLVRNGKVVVIRPKTSNNPEKRYNEEDVILEFGINPRDFACFLCFRGDDVDNIPGVPMVRSSLIGYLAEKYREPAKIYANLDAEKFTDFQKQSLINFEPQATLNWTLVRLYDKLEVIVKKGLPNPLAIAPYLDKYEIKKIDPQAYSNFFVDIKKSSSPVLTDSSFF